MTSEQIAPELRRNNEPQRDAGRAGSAGVSVGALPLSSPGATTPRPAWPAWNTPSASDPGAGARRPTRSRSDPQPADTNQPRADRACARSARIFRCAQVASPFGRCQDDRSWHCKLADVGQPSTTRKPAMVPHTFELTWEPHGPRSTGSPCDQVAPQSRRGPPPALARADTRAPAPSPASWYATCRPLFFAYRVSGSVTVTRSPSRDASAAEEH